MKRNNKSVICLAALALVAGCSRQNPMPMQQQMTQMCGMDQSGQQSCIMVPANQQAQYNNQGYYQYQNGQYRDSHGDAIAAGVVAGLGGYMLGRAHANAQTAREYNDQRRYYDNQRSYDNGRGYDNRSQPAYATTQANAPQRTEFVPQNAKTAVTGKAPTGGLMAGHTDINLNNTGAQPSRQFTPTAAKNFAPAQAPVVPTYQPTPASRPMPAPSTFTPRAAGNSFTPAASKPSTYTPSAFKPSSSGSSFRPSSSGSSFKPSAARKK